MEKGIAGPGEGTAMTKTEVADAVHQGMMRYEMAKGAAAAIVLASLVVVCGGVYLIRKMMEE